MVRVCAGAPSSFESYAMQARIRLLALILGVPLLGFAVSTGMRAYLATELRTIAHKHMRDSDSSSLSTLTVERLCEAPGRDSIALCEHARNLALMRNASLAAALVGLVLVSSI